MVSRISTIVPRISVTVSRISATVRGRVGGSPAALPAAPSVVAMVTTRKITITAIPYIIIYIRAVTL